MLALDDFGTGFSSLGYLKDLPIDTIKIDQKFIADLERDPISRLIVESVVRLGPRVGHDGRGGRCGECRSTERCRRTGVRLLPGLPLRPSDVGPGGGARRPLFCVTIGWPVQADAVRIRSGCR